MKNKGIIALVAMLLVILSVVVVYSSEEPADSANRTCLIVSSEGPYSLYDIINDVKTGSYYEGYDNETLAWMESLGDKQVFSGKGILVVMDADDASKIPSEFVCDAYINDFIECDVLENHSLGDVKYPKDGLLIENVNYLGQEIHYLQGS